MNNTNIPANIRRKILSGNIFTIIIGIILIIAIFTLKETIIKNYIDDAIILNAFNTGLLISIICVLILLCVIPTLVLLSGIESKRIKEIMRKSKIGERELSIDFDNTKPIGRMKVGDLCVYYKSGYFFTVIPKQHILWVSKDTKINKQKRVTRAMDGTIKDERYTISEKKRFVVTIHTLYGKSIVVNCNMEKTADAIIQHFNVYDHIIIGSGIEYKKAYKELKKKTIKEEKGE